MLESSLASDVSREGHIEMETRLGQNSIHHLRSESTPTMRKVPMSLYAKQYLVGAHETIGHGPAVL